MDWLAGIALVRFFYLVFLGNRIVVKQQKY